MEENLSMALWKSANRRLDETILIYYGRKFKYRDLIAAVKEYAALFSLNGVEPGDRVALMMTNTPQFVFSYYGALLAGAIVVPINLLDLPQSYKHISEVKIPKSVKEQIKDSQPKVIVAFDFFSPILDQIQDELKQMKTKVILTGVQDYLPFPLNKLYPIMAKKQGNWVKKRDIPFGFVHLKDLFFRLGTIWKMLISSEPWEDFPGTDGKYNDVTQLQYTGGTTGVPKGAMLTHRNLLSNIGQCRIHMGKYIENGYTSMLGILPFFHVYGMTVCMNMSLLSIGAPLVLVPSAKDIKKWVGWIKKYQIKGVPSVPKLFQRLGDYPKLATKENFQSVKLFVNGAGALPKLVREKFEELSGAKVFEGYGLSEASPVVSVCTPDDRKEGSAGKSLPGTEIKIVDLDTDKEIPAGTKKDNDYKTGEIIVYGPQVMQGYWNKPEETAEALKDGWLYTGDVGYVDKDGFLFITDRKKDMVKILGENVYPVKVEKALAVHSCIEEVAVVGVIDMAKGDKLVAVVVLSKEGGNNKEAGIKDILDHAKGKLAKHEVPSEIIVVSSLDEYKNNLGKVLKKKIREDIKKGILK